MLRKLSRDCIKPVQFVAKLTYQFKAKWLLVSKDPCLKGASGKPKKPQQNSGISIAVKTSDLYNSNRPNTGSMAQLKLLAICKNLKSGAKTVKIFTLGD